MAKLPCPDEEAVIVRIKLSDQGFVAWPEKERFHRIESSLLCLLEGGEVGEYGSHDFEGGDGLLFIYGLGADALGEFLTQAARGLDLEGHASLVKRYGGPGAREETVNL